MLTRATPTLRFSARPADSVSSCLQTMSMLSSLTCCRGKKRNTRLADYLLCPSDFVRKTFVDEGLDSRKLLRHQYGYDESLCHPAASAPSDSNRGLTMLFAGDCAIRKGVHFALEAWLRSGAHHNGSFMIAGTFLPAYADRLAGMLAHPSVKVLGYRRDVPELMRKSDLFVLAQHRRGQRAGRIRGARKWVRHSCFRGRGCHLHPP